MTNRYTTDPMSQASPTVFNGRYELQRRLARGGMADVFLARDRLLDRPIAIKVLFPDLAADPAFVERFRREAQAAANLNHPNIVSIFDWGQQDDTYFIVMEFIDGRSLADLIRTQGVLDADRAAEIAGDVAAALGFAHRSGVIHRDVKPGNVLITSEGQVKVADFGIATVLSDTNTDLTRAGTVMGTATYFSPEQAQGRSVDARSDLYSLGAVLFEMVAGRPPFKGETPLAVAIKHVQEQPPSPRALGANIAESLEAITLKLLAKNPDNRYPTADDLRADLRRYREGMHSLRRAPALAVAAGTAPTQVVGAVRAGAGTGVHSQGTAVLPSTHSTTFYEPPPENRVGMIIAVTMLLLLSIAGLVFAFVNVLNNDDPPAAADVEVPNVIDKLEGDAIAAIVGSGFPTPQVIQQVKDDKTPGTVYAQQPEAGKMVKPTTSIVISVSLGAGTDFPRYVVGLSADEAENTLKSQGYAVQRVSQPSIDVPEGFVISQDPPPEKELQKGKTVLIRISTGGQETTLPNVTNQPIDLVLKTLTDLKLKVDQVREASETIDTDRVIRTDPGPGKVKEGQRITVVVSDGFPKFEMPDLRNLTQDEAVAALNAKGLKSIQIETQQVGADDERAGKVISQSLPAGTQVRTNQTVRLTIGKAPPPTTTASTTTTTRPNTTTTTRD